MDIHGGAHVGGDIVQSAVDLGAISIPAVENRGDRSPQLRLHILRERLTRLLLADRLVLRDDAFPIFRFHLRIGKEALVFLRDFERFLEQTMIHAEHDIGIHLDEAAVGIPGETRIA